MLKVSDLITALQQAPPDAKVFLGIQPVRDSQAVPEHDWADVVSLDYGGSDVWIYGFRYRDDCRSTGERDLRGSQS